MSLKSSIKRRLKNHPVRYLAQDLCHAFVQSRDWQLRTVSLQTEGPALGNALLSYITEPFLLKAGQRVSASHQHDWESRDMANALLELGYNVDVIRWNNLRWIPTKQYDILIDARLNMERLAPLVGPGCLKIMHVETSHWLLNMALQHRRLLDLQHRRGITLPLEKVVAANWAIEHADCGVIQGNYFSAESYAYAAKPLYRLHTSAVAMYPWPESRDLQQCRRNFLWLGSSGLVHKGLDLVLEAFAGMPECQLTVCAPFGGGDRAFEKEYRKELYETPNIHTAGWVDVTGARFQELAASCMGTVYVSCAESGGGSVLQCMHAGLVPVVSTGASVDVDDFGVVLPENSIEEIRRTVRWVSMLPVEELNHRARKAWNTARNLYTRENFAREYRAILRQILTERGRPVRGAFADGIPISKGKERSAVG